MDTQPAKTDTDMPILKGRIAMAMPDLFDKAIWSQRTCTIMPRAFSVAEALREDLKKEQSHIECQDMRLAP